MITDNNIREVVSLIFTIIIFHWGDMYYTMKRLQKDKKKFVNPEIFELNYHRIFMQKFGIEKGVKISIFISTTFFVLTSFLVAMFSETKFLYLFVGMNLTMAYNNFSFYITDDEINKKIIKRE